MIIRFLSIKATDSLNLSFRLIQKYKSPSPKQWAFYVV